MASSKKIMSIVEAGPCALHASECFKPPALFFALSLLRPREEREEGARFCAIYETLARVAEGYRRQEMYSNKRISL